MEKRHITIKDIAKEAGVSTATVSMVFNNKDKNISKATRDKILKIGKDFNYIPNSIARSLVTKRTNTLGLLVPDIVNPFFPEIARGAEDRARESSYSIIICNTDDDVERENNYLNVLSEKMVDGIILTHSANRSNEKKGLESCRVPLILIDRDYDLENLIGKVLIDNTSASYDGVSYLIEKNYKKIAYIAGPLNTRTAKDRLNGYKKALYDHSIEYDENLVLVGEYRSQWGSDASLRLIENAYDIDAIFCGNDLIAIGAMKTLGEHNIKIPDDIGIMGFDDIYISSLVNPELTTIKQPNYKMGYEAVNMMIDYLENKNIKEKTLILNTDLIIRKSC